MTDDKKIFCDVCIECRAPVGESHTPSCLESRFPVTLQRSQRVLLDDPTRMLTMAEVQASHDSLPAVTYMAVSIHLPITLHRRLVLMQHAVGFSNMSEAIEYLLENAMKGS